MTHSLEHLFSEQVSFSPSAHPKIRESFYRAWLGFPLLHTHFLQVNGRPLKGNSMRAQPIINPHFFFKDSRHYKVEYQTKTLESIGFALTECPDEVLEGWFAHELGHVIDYLDRSWMNMIFFGFNYTLSPTFRIGAERQADVYAIDRGFGRTIQRTKNFILKESNVSDRYLSKINKYYLSPDEVEQLILDREETTINRDRVV